ncbi:MAG: MarC family protein, partial [Pseudobdellovibrionaceae bacterium]
YAMLYWNEHFSLIALGFSSFFPLINPIGTALIINPFFSGATLSQRKGYSISIILSCFFLGLAVLFLGSWILKFMGISIPTTQMAGGLIIARMGLELLNPPVRQADKETKAKVSSSLFYPLAFPLTLGPGGISVLITLSAHSHSGNLSEILIRMSICAASLVAVLIVTYFCFVYSDSVIKKIGPSGSLVLDRLMAFIVFCIGIQMLLTGFTNSFPAFAR